MFIELAFWTDVNEKGSETIVTKPVDFSNFLHKAIALSELCMVSLYIMQFK